MVMEKLLKDLRTNNKLKCLKQFNSRAAVVLKDDDYNFSREIIAELKTIIEEPSSTVDALVCLKTLARDKRVAQGVDRELFQRILLLGQLSNIQEDQSAGVVLAARRALFNITYNNSTCQHICFNKQPDLVLLQDLKHFDSEDFESRQINCKLIFLLTAVSAQIRTRVTANEGLDVLNKIMLTTVYGGEAKSKRICFGDKHVDKETKIILSLEDVVILTDVFMAVFNITSHLEDTQEMDLSLEELVLFCKTFYKGVDHKENSDVFTNMVSKFVPILINLSTCFHQQLVSPVDNNFKGNKYMDHDIAIPSLILNNLAAELDKKSGPTDIILIALMTVLYKLSDNRAARKYLRQNILPPLRSVTKRPDEEKTLKSKIVKIMTSPNQQLSTITSELLFTLCKHNVDRMIKYTGYGNSAGLFNRRGLLMMNNRDKTQWSEDEDSDTEEYKLCENSIDLVTAGPAKENTALLSMSEAEKEIEANKLMNLIDDMHRKGVIKPGGVGPDGKVREMDIAEQMARIPESVSSDESSDEVEVALDSHAFFPRKKEDNK